MGLKEKILVNVYRSMTLSQFLYAPILVSASNTGKEEMIKQQIRFFNIIGITTERALSQYNIPTLASSIEKQCLAITERILKDPNHTITQAQEAKKITIKHTWLSICSFKSKYQIIPRKLPTSDMTGEKRWVSKQIYKPKKS